MRTDWANLLEPTGAPPVGTLVRLPSSLLHDRTVAYAWAVRIPGWSEDTGLLCVALLHAEGAWKVDTLSTHSSTWRQAVSPASVPEPVQTTLEELRVSHTSIGSDAVISIVRACALLCVFARRRRCVISFVYDISSP